MSQLLPHLPRRTVVVPLVVTFLMISCSVIGWALIRHDENGMLKDETRVNAEHFAERLESHIRTRLTLMEQVRYELLHNPVSSESEFQLLTKAAHELFGDFQAINWVNPDGIIEWISPVETNERARGLDVGKLEFPSRAIAAARRTGNVQLTPPIRLAQGVDGFVAYMPVGRDGSKFGFLNIVFSIEPLILAAEENGFLDKFKLTIRDGDRVIYNSVKTDEVTGPPYNTEIVIGNRTWQIAAAKAEAFASPYATSFDEIVFVIGLMVSLIVGYLVRLAMVHQQILHASDKVFRTFVENSPSAILIKNVEGRYMYANSLWHQWFNPQGLPIEGKTVHDFFSEHHALAIEAEEKRVLETGETVEAEIRSPLANGTLVPTLLQKFPIFDGQGRIIAIGGINTDLRSRKQTEQELRQALAKAEEASKSKSKFLATMSHELRTPLNAIIGFSDLLHGQYFGPMGKEKYIEYARDIHDSGQHLLSLIDDVLDISAIELGKRELVMAPISLDDVLPECIKSLENRAVAAHINLILATPSNLPKILGDDTAIKQIFLNLLTNSIKFSFPGSKVVVYAEVAEETVKIVVKDTGSGINASVLEKITEPFVKGHHDSDTTHEGVGLGLSIVKSLVVAHKGTMEIESEIGVGTKITIGFPKLSERLAA